MEEKELLERFKNKLIEEYGYDEQDIKIEVKLDELIRNNIRYIPDIVVYKNHKPYIIIEIKSNYSNRIFEQAFEKISHATRYLNAKYCVIATLDVMEAYELKNHELYSISNIPNKNNEIFNQHSILDDNKLVHLFSEIRDIIWSGGKRDDFTVINQFNKLLLIKYYIEKEKISFTHNKKFIDLKQFNDLFYEANRQYSIFEEKEKFSLSEDEFHKLIDLLKYINLNKTENIDKIYMESFIKPLKNEQLLSEELVKFIKQIDIKKDLLVVNSGFGQLSLNFDFSFNIESNRIKVETAKILQLLKGFRQEYFLGEVLKDNLTSNKFDSILAIPPISFKVKEYYEYKIEKEKTNKDYACLVIEKSLELIKDNGFLFIIVPNGVLSNLSYINSRNFIQHYFNILSVTSLPSSTFLNTNILTSLLILQKKQYINLEQQVPVLFSVIETYQDIEKISLEINKILSNSYDLIDKELIDYKNLKDRWDSHYYENDFLKLEKKILSLENHPLNHYVEVIRGSSLGNHSLGIIPLITVSSIENGKIIKEKLSKVTKNDNNNNPRGKVFENDLIITVVGRRPKCALVTKEFEGANTNSGIVILRPKSAEIRIDFLYDYLNSAVGEILLYRGITYTSTVPILTQAEIEKIPVIIDVPNDFLNDFPKLKEMFSYNKFYENVSSTITEEECKKEIEKELNSYRNQIESLSNDKLNEFQNKFTFLEDEENIFSVFGLAGDVFGINVIRTFVTLEHLKNFETDRQNFQRELNLEHNYELITFLKEGNYKFFPEIVLGIKNIDDLKKNDYLVQELIESNSGITKLVFKDKKAFDNIEVLDGRHRIESIKKYLEDDTVNKKDTVSIVFILLDESQTIDLLDKAIFYNLNAKARVLEPIDYLNLLNNDEKDKLKDLKITNINIFKFLKDNVEKIFYENDRKLTLSKCIYLTDTLVNIFGDENIEILKIEILNLFENINKRVLYKYDISLKTKFYMLIAYIVSKKPYLNSINISLFIEKEINGFIEWLNLSNLMGSLTDIRDLKDFYLTYEKTYIPKSRKIYISMPYHKETEWTFFLIKDIINEISNNLQIKIELIRTDQQTNGVHTGISEKVYNEIESCDLMIADLTGGNANVFNEVGFKMGLDKAQGLKETQIIFIVNSKCYYEEHLENESFIDNEYKVNGKILKKNSKPVPFNLRGIKHIEFYDSHYLKAELYKELEKYFSYYKITKVSK